MTLVIGLNNFFGDAERNDGFRREDAVGTVRAARDFALRLEREYDVEVHGWDCVDWNSDRVRAVLYLDCSWRSVLNDPFLKRIPKEKRALFLIEPANVNPSLYYTSHFRDMFHTVFTWDEKLLARNPGYIEVCVPPFAEPPKYRRNPFARIPFAEKKLLFAASSNRWHYMPQSTFGKRRRVYSWFDRRLPNRFDLFGEKWNEPIVWYEKILGYPRYRCWRGFLPGGVEAKLEKMTHYRFALCFENNASQPGYVSEKIVDCLCARCVPIYLGSAGIERRIPRACFIDYRDFGSPGALEDFIVGMDEVTHGGYLAAIEEFLRSPSADFFTSDHNLRQIARGLGLRRRGQW